MNRYGQTRPRPQPAAPAGRLFADPRPGPVLRRGRRGDRSRGDRACATEILGPPRPGESLEDYRLRSYQALATAEELILADHHLFQPEPTTGTEDWTTTRTWTATTGTSPRSTRRSTPPL